MTQIQIRRISVAIVPGAQCPMCRGAIDPSVIDNPVQKYDLLVRISSFIPPPSHSRSFRCVIPIRLLRPLRRQLIKVRPLLNWNLIQMHQHTRRPVSIVRACAFILAKLAKIVTRFDLPMGTLLLVSRIAPNYFGDHPSCDHFFKTLIPYGSIDMVLI